MALIKEVLVDSIEVLEWGHIQVRTVTRIIEDGTELSHSYHRHTLTPEDNLDGQDAKVIAIANATWTPEAIEKYKAKMKELENN